MHPATLADGRATRFVSGLGATTADAFFGAVAGFGLTLVSALTQGQAVWLRLIGGAFLGYLGVRTFLAKPADQAAPASNSNSQLRLLTAYLSTLFLTITNPATLLSFIAVFGVLKSALEPITARQGRWWRACSVDRRCGGSR